MALLTVSEVSTLTEAGNSLLSSVFHRLAGNCNLCTCHVTTHSYTASAEIQCLLCKRKLVITGLWHFYLSNLHTQAQHNTYMYMYRQRQKSDFVSDFWIRNQAFVWSYMIQLTDMGDFGMLCSNRLTSSIVYTVLSMCTIPKAMPPPATPQATPQVPIKVNQKVIYWKVTYLLILTCQETKS